MERVQLCLRDSGRPATHPQKTKMTACIHVHLVPNASIIVSLCWSWLSPTHFHLFICSLFVNHLPRATLFCMFLQYSRLLLYILNGNVLFTSVSSGLLSYYPFILKYEGKCSILWVCKIILQN